MNNDLISRSALTDAIVDLLVFEWGYEGIEASVKRIFSEIPAVDAETVCKQMGLVKEALEMAKADLVAVVRCRDCVHLVRCKDCKHGVWDKDEELWKCVVSADQNEEVAEYIGFLEYHFGSKYKEKAKIVEKVCKAIIDKLVQSEDDIAIVRHGRWDHIGGDEWCCTNCGEVISTEGSWDKPTYKHCHECGAKMDGSDT